MEGEEYIPEYGGEEKDLRREEKRKKWILMFFIYGEEEEQRSPVCCEIRDSRLFIGVFYRWFYRRIIKY
jgi:hypothetical protein